MRRTALLVVLVVAGLGGAATSSTTLPASTVGYQSVRVTGGTPKDINYTVTANTITALTVRLKGPKVSLLGVPLFTTVTARFGSGTTVTCAIGLYDAVSDSTAVTCTPFTQRANASWSLQITVS